MKTDADERCALAMRLQLSGQADLAETAYREILQSDPEHAATHHCLGMLELQLDRAAQGVPHLLKALELAPAVPDYWLGYLEALLLLGREEEAGAALALARGHGLSGAATEDFSRRLSARGERATRVREQEADLIGHLKQGRLTDARVLAQTLIEHFPESGLAWKASGVFLWVDGHQRQAAEAMRACLRRIPEDVEAWSHLGGINTKLGLLTDAEAAQKKAIQIDPHYAPAHYRLGSCYLLMGKMTQAQHELRTAIALQPDCGTEEVTSGYSNLLFALCHDATIDADTLFREHCRAGERFEAGLRAAWPRHSNGRDPERRLRVGMVSADFRNHAVASFLEPILPTLARRPGLELWAYYSNTIDDEVSRRLREHFHHWQPVDSMHVSDAELARRILADGIDILVDLSGHTGGNRLGAFARKPAPIQVSWLGYVGTTGLRAMDYYLTDRHYLPRDQFERQFTEQLVYLPAMAPFQPHEAAPPISALPALAAGSLCFGSFNRLHKINPPTLALWSRLLQALPDSRMLMGAMPPGPARDQIIAEFSQHGIRADRLSFRETVGMDAYLAMHQDIDICLDTQPWSGGTTTNHALWMGVPTLTKVGTTPASRLTAALSQQVGLEAFIADSDDEFVAKGVYWANHLQELAGIRASLRERCVNAPVRQPDLIATALERAFRIMWRRWCDGQSPMSFAVDDLDALRTDTPKNQLL